MIPVCFWEASALLSKEAVAQVSPALHFSKAGLPLQLAVQLPSGQRFAGCVFFSKETLLCSWSAGAWDWFGGRPVCVCARRGFILPAAGGWRRMRAITRDFRNQRRSRPAERAAEQPLQSVGSGGAEQCRVSEQSWTWAAGSDVSDLAAVWPNGIVGGSEKSDISENGDVQVGEVKYGTKREREAEGMTREWGWSS